MIPIMKIICDIKCIGFLLLIVTLDLGHSGTPNLPRFCSSTSGLRCDYTHRGQRLTCSGGISTNSSYPSKEVRVLILCQWPESTFDLVGVLTQFPQLHNFTLTHGNVTRIEGDFPAKSRFLKAVNMSHLGLKELAPSTFNHLKKVRTVDLSFNMLTQLNLDLVARPASLEQIFVVGNEWNCSDALLWLVDDGRNSSVASRVVDRDKMLCATPYPGKPVLAVMTYLKALRADCPETPPANCSCLLTNVVRGPVSLVPVITVDCSRRGLQEMPEKIPANTTTLLLTGNQISNVRPLVTNVHYGTLKDVYLDDNRVHSIDVLEGVPWLLQFRVLSLRGNSLTQVPNYALDNALERNRNVVNVYLGNNPWKCDCEFTPAFQGLLVKYLTLVKDVDDVKCSSEDRNENALRPIRDLPRGAVCHLPSEYAVRPLDLVNGILASLIVLVIGKLAYDFWSFKKTGKLPWIVAKMP